MKKFTAIAVVIFLAACSQSPKKVVGVKVGDEYYATDQAASFELTKTGDKDKIVCDTHKKTGSNIKIKTCTTLEQKRLEKQRAEEMRQNNSINNTQKMTRSFRQEGGGG